MRYMFEVRGYSSSRHESHHICVLEAEGETEVEARRKAMKGYKGPTKYEQDPVMVLLVEDPLTYKWAKGKK